MKRLADTCNDTRLSVHPARPISRLLHRCAELQRAVRDSRDGRQSRLQTISRQPIRPMEKGLRRLHEQLGRRRDGVSQPAVHARQRAEELSGDVRSRHSSRSAVTRMSSDTFRRTRTSIPSIRRREPTARLERAKVMDWCRANLGIVGTEAGCDWTVPYADYATPPNIEKAICVPLFNLVYHDAILSPASPSDLRGLLNGCFPQIGGRQETLARTERGAEANDRAAQARGVVRDDESRVSG